MYGLKIKLKNAGLMLAALAFTISANAQQWHGSTSSTGAVYRTGSTGIGTTTPDGLHVTAPLTGETTTVGTGTRIGNFDGTPRIIFDKAGSSSFEMDNLNGRFRIFVPGIERFTIVGASGNVGIGTNNPDARLSVNGDIHAKEVRVDLSVPGPDYVFEKDYKLMPLAELEAYLRLNKHLPEVPSAKTMEENGVELKAMNMLLLKKVEELTLYMIEMKKENSDLRERLEKLESEK